jgi:hypothetical protein
VDSNELTNAQIKDFTGNSAWLPTTQGDGLKFNVRQMDILFGQLICNSSILSRLSEKTAFFFLPTEQTHY